MCHLFIRYGEGWNFGEVAQNGRGINASQFNLCGTGIGRFEVRCFNRFEKKRAVCPFFIFVLVDAFEKGHLVTFFNDCSTFL